MQKIAVVLFNLGGPDSIKAVKPFLFNLFNDKAIIDAPNPVRFLLAKLISSKREKKAIGIYNQIGGKSPIVEETLLQAKALESLLPENYKVFFSMRYWKPFSAQVVKEIEEFSPQKIIFLPLYPQYSTTTTASSFLDFEKALKNSNLKNIIINKICCYPNEEGFAKAVASNIKQKIKDINVSKYRFLFSAHGLPEKIIKSGDPYKFQVELSVKEVLKHLNINNIDYVICFQSRVGPLKWITPYTEDEIKKAGYDGKSIVLIPIAFVSEHSETLVELDIEYNHLAKESNVKDYIRISSVRDNDFFIKGLKNLVENAVAENKPIISCQKTCICQAENTKCAIKINSKKITS